MKRILILMLVLSTYALAAEVKSGETDIVQRAVNFLLFAGLVWYLVGEPIKNFFASRSQKIVDELKKVQDKLNETAKSKEEALAKIAEAEKFAEELAESLKKENKVLNDNIMTQCDTDLEVLARQYHSKKELEQKNMVRDVVEKIITETLGQSSEIFDRKAMANVILKKVA